MAIKIPFNQSAAPERTLATTTPVASSLYLKNGSSIFNSTASGFWSAITGFNQGGSGRGFSTNTAFTANTYKTIASFTGSGYLANIITPVPSATTQFTIRITKDGQVFTSNAISLASNRRLVIGVTVAGQPSSTAGEAVGLNNQQADGFSTQPRLSIVPPEQAMQLGDVVSFRQSLTVEISANQNIAVSNQNARAAVLLVNDLGIRL